MQTQPSVHSSGAAHVTGPARVLSAPAAPHPADRPLAAAHLPARRRQPAGPLRPARRRGRLRRRRRAGRHRALPGSPRALPLHGRSRSSPSARATPTAASRSTATCSRSSPPPTASRCIRWSNACCSRAQRARANSLSGSRNNIHAHYDLGNDFYRLWLDERMLYTCAYFPTPDATLEEAQVAKMHHVCRKVRAASRRARRRGRLRLGLAGAAHGPPLRRHRARLQHLARADRLRPRAGGARGARRSRRVHRGRLPQHHRHVRLLHVGRHARARRPRPLSRARRGDRPQPARARPRPHPHHRPHPADATSTPGSRSTSSRAATRRRCAR